MNEQLINQLPLTWQQLAPPAERLERAFELFQQHQKGGGVTNATMKTYASRLKIFIKWLAEHGIDQADQLTHEIVDRWAASMTEVSILYDDDKSS